jgi:para-aminobenzoate synthetase/4-amino-4-deoxychorismate lyase
VARTLNWHPLPASVYALVEQTPATVLLESARAGSSNKVSRLFVAPLRVIEAHRPSEICCLFDEIENAVAQGNFVAGFFTYECGAAFEPNAAGSTRGAAAYGSTSELPGPLAWFGIYENCHVFDHATGRFVGDDLPGLANFLTAGPRDAVPEDQSVELAPALDESEFAGAIDAIHEWIRAGDVYQLNFTFPLTGRALAGPAALYAQLRRRQPVDYSAFVHLGAGGHILSFSPELFFRIDGPLRRITTQPMKGTAPRGRTTAEDREIAGQLQNDAKNRAENVMIVDLLRSDLGRLCAYGSVEVRDLFAVERYPTLWQMTSTVTGTLRKDAGYHDIFRALFPCGSITGAPKVRAMQLISDLEGGPRGVYTGAIGFFSREETVFNVAIRTLELDRNRATMGVGSGIVIDSSAGEEYRECLLKAEFLARPSQDFSLIETMLWEGGYPLLDLHLDRLEDSANYFDFAFDRGEIEAALRDAAEKFADRLPRRVRLLLSCEGSLQIEHETLPPNTTEPPRVCIASDRTDAKDRFLYHKTTHRALYANAYRAASAAGFADVLFLNQEGQLTEGAISNVFIEKAGHWSTPPVSCGLLPGVQRRHLLATRPEIEERMLTLDDLKSADAVYIANAVRGLRRVVIDWSGLR